MKQMDKEIKISFTGDIMFEKPYLKSVLNKKTDFHNLFIQVKDLIKQSDYVVGNLETVCAGKDKNYTHGIYSFNSPDGVLDAIKDAGFTMVTTANNHCLDRGVAGLVRTLKELNKRKIDHTGTSIQTNNNKFFVKDFSGIKIAFISYTYGTNYIENKVELKKSELGLINLLKPQKSGVITTENENPNFLRKALVKFSQLLFSSDTRMQIKKILGLRLNVPITDKIHDGDINEEYLSKFSNQIKKAKQVSDFVFVCLHTGGQFNDKPGEFSEFLMNYAVENGADAIIGNHPHIVQEFKLINSVPVFYSLGNFSFSPSSIYVLHELLPEYSVMPHFYFKKTEGSYQLKKITCSLLKTVEDKNYMIQVIPVSQLLKSTEDKLKKQKLLREVDFIIKRLHQEIKITNDDVSELELYSV